MECNTHTQHVIVCIIITIRSSLHTHTAMIKQFLTDVVWGELDYLIVDTPPGTSDEHISVVESLRSVNPEGAILVTTPQVSGQGPWEVVGLDCFCIFLTPPPLSLPLPPVLPLSLPPPSLPPVLSLSLSPSLPPSRPPSLSLPQGVALSDVRRELTFCRKTKLPVLGIIENMSGFVCPHCSVRYARQSPPSSVVGVCTTALAAILRVSFLCFSTELC